MSLVDYDEVTTSIKREGGQMWKSWTRLVNYNLFDDTRDSTRQEDQHTEREVLINSHGSCCWQYSQRVELLSLRSEEERAICTR